MRASCESIQGSQRIAAAGWEALRGHTAQGLPAYQVWLWSCPLEIGQECLAARNREKNDRMLGSLRTKEPLHLALRAWASARGALVGPDDQGLIADLGNPRGWARVNSSREAHTCPGAARLRFGQAGMLIAAERPASPGAAKAPSFVLGGCHVRPLPLRSEVADKYGSLAQEGFGGQGALVQPEWTRGSVLTQHAVGLRRR